MAEGEEKKIQFKEGPIADNKYGQLRKDIVDLLQRYEIEYFREDKPIPFNGLTIYPATVRDFEVFSMCTSCLTLNKNETKEGIKMSHLDYLISKLQDPKEGQMWSYKLQKLFEIVFHITNGLKCTHCGEVMKYDSPAFMDFIKDFENFTKNTKMQDIDQNNIQPPQLKCPHCEGTEFQEMIKTMPDSSGKGNCLLIDGHEISKQDFNKLRQIILYQNFSDYADDSWVDPAIKRDHDEKLRLEQMKSDLHASIEKKVVCLSIATNYKFDEIYNMPIRKFNLALSTVDDLINYKIMKQAIMSGFVSLPKGQTIEHWIYKPNKDMYGDTYKTVEEIQNSLG